MHKINLTLVFFLIFTIISSALTYTIVLSAYSTYDNIYSQTFVTQAPTTTSYKDLIKVSFLQAGDVIKSPLVVKGEARGNWYFEASFPVRLYDANSVEIPLTPSYIMATGDWMTTDFVPFEATLTFSAPVTQNGTLVFEKDNPSGLPENDDSISIPIKFY